VTDQPDRPDRPEDSDSPDTGQPDVLVGAEQPTLPDMPEVPEVTDVPETPEVAGAAELPVAPDAGVTPEQAVVVDEAAAEPTPSPTPAEPPATPGLPPTEPAPEVPAEPLPDLPPAEPAPEVPDRPMMSTPTSGQAVVEETPTAPAVDDRPADVPPTDAAADAADVPPTEPAADAAAAPPAADAGAPSAPSAPAPPGPHPTPAAAAPAAAAAAAPVPPPSDPTEWGRVDDEGTVWVRTADGERSVGSYPGAEAPEALAYFGRKFDELAGQVTLLEQRVASGGVSLADAQTSVDHLREQVVDANAVGDLAGLSARLDTLTEAIATRKARRDAERAKSRERAAAAKEKIVAEAESLSGSTEWKKTGDRMRSLLDEWKAAPRLDRKSDDALWKRFSHARTAFDKRRRVHFAELDEQRGEAAARKEKLIKEAEALSTSREWGETAKKYRELMDRWKAAGRARRDVEDELWTRFRAAQDVFFSARSEVFAARDADLATNLEKKQKLLVEAEALLPVTDHRAARQVLRTIHEKWEAAGHVPRASKDAVENRLRRVDEAVRAAEQAEWARTNPEARARAEATVTQLQASIAGLEKDAAAARAAGNEKKAADAEAAVETRRSWLVEAEKTLAEFS
jgi:hypothetical protein